MGLEFIYKEECYNIIGAAMEVHKTLGRGFLEPVYQEALKIEFEQEGIPWADEVLLDIIYKGRLLDKKYVADFVCYGQIILELKAVDRLTPEHVAQVLNYLKATKMNLGLLINFGALSLQYKRIIL
ncbi:MAG: GxxExxY protein [Porphyromonadaceae bacterium]|nr:MAG: GxxExxY protein [Porphyromonadaceae bacterium]